MPSILCARLISSMSNLAAPHSASATTNSSKSSAVVAVPSCAPPSVCAEEKAALASSSERPSRIGGSLVPATPDDGRTVSSRMILRCVRSCRKTSSRSCDAASFASRASFSAAAAGPAAAAGAPSAP